MSFGWFYNNCLIFYICSHFLYLKCVLDLTYSNKIFFFCQNLGFCFPEVFISRVQSGCYNLLDNLNYQLPLQHLVLQYLFRVAHTSNYLQFLRPPLALLCCITHLHMHSLQLRFHSRLQGLHHLRWQLPSRRLHKIHPHHSNSLSNNLSLQIKQSKRLQPIFLPLNFIYFILNQVQHLNFLF